MAKGGRKRSPGRRHKCGKLVQSTIGPTSETTAQRIALIGTADPALAESVLGILRARRLIDEIEMQAGLLYERDHRAVWGSSHAQTVHLPVKTDLTSEGGQAPIADHRTPDQRDVAHARRLALSEAAVSPCGPTACGSLRAIAIDRSMPVWLVPLLEAPISSDACDAAVQGVAPLRRCLQALAVRYGLLPAISGGSTARVVPAVEVRALALTGAND